VIHEFDLDGVFLHGALVLAMASGVTLLIVKRLGDHFGVYRHFANPGLVDVAMFMILWWLLTLLARTQG
jgi:hypothetical protein